MGSNPKSTPAQQMLAFFAFFTFLISLANFLGHNFTGVAKILEGSLNKYPKDLAKKERLIREFNDLLDPYKINVIYEDSLNRIGKIDTLPGKKDSCGNVITNRYRYWVDEKPEWSDWVVKAQFIDGSTSFIQIDTPKYIRYYQPSLTPAEVKNKEIDSRHIHIALVQVYRFYDPLKGTFSRWHDTYFKFNITSIIDSVNPSKLPKSTALVQEKPIEVDSSSNILTFIHVKKHDKTVINPLMTSEPSLFLYSRALRERRIVETTRR